MNYLIGFILGVIVATAGLTWAQWDGAQYEQQLLNLQLQQFLQQQRALEMQRDFHPYTPPYTLRNPC